MSKNVNVKTGDYKITVPDGNTITFDTGVDNGKVVFTGDFEVQGTTTTVSSENLTVTDNIIRVNNGETGAGVTLTEAGIAVDRGTEQTAFIVFNEDVSWNDPVTNTQITGAFLLRNANEDLIGLKTSAIITDGDDLYFDLSNGSGVIQVVNSTDYETKVTADDHITNKKYVDDAIVAGIQGITIKRIQQGDSKVELFDESVEPGEQSRFNVEVDGSEVAVFKAESSTIEGITFQNNEIQTATSGDELILRSFGAGSVTIDGYLKIPDQDNDPTYDTDGTLVYSKGPGLGTTGIYYVNSENTSDELISRNRSLVYSMIF